jgi:putative endonuclease
MAPGGERARERGRKAEDLAAAWLERQGFRLLDRNHATRYGEVDLVCQEGATLCFVEVRSRSDLGHGTPAETVTPAKARRVVDAATDWARRHRSLERPVRFDVVAVEWRDDGPRLTLYRGAFDAAGRSR